MTDTKLNGKTVRSGTKLTFDFESCIDEWGDQRMTVTVQRVNDHDEMVLARASGEEFGFIAESPSRSDYDARMYTFSTRVLGELYNLEVEDDA